MYAVVWNKIQTLQGYDPFLATLKKVVPKFTTQKKSTRKFHNQKSPRGPFLESPDSFPGPKTIFSAQYSRIAIQFFIDFES